MPQSHNDIHNRKYYDHVLCAIIFVKIQNMFQSYGPTCVLLTDNITFMKLFTIFIPQHKNDVHKCKIGS